MEWKTDEMRSYECFSYYTTVEYQIATNKKAGVTEIRKHNALILLILQ